LGLRANNIRPRRLPQGGESHGFGLACGAGTWSSAFIKTHLAGAGGARSRANYYSCRYLNNVTGLYGFDIYEIGGSKRIGLGSAMSHNFDFSTMSI
jgi:hypothetical protein